MVTVTASTVRGSGRYVGGSLAVAIGCLCVLGRIRVCVYQFVGVHIRSALAEHSLAGTGPGTGGPVVTGVGILNPTAVLSTPKYFLLSERAVGRDGRGIVLLRVAALALAGVLFRTMNYEL